VLPGAALKPANIDSVVSVPKLVDIVCPNLNIQRMRALQIPIQKHISFAAALALFT
tara:strand:- start:359 stop:526 length:168 start_codon:yes stop_codon:yes gene_type:complete